MSQTVVSEFYTSRKRIKDPVKSIKNVVEDKLSESLVNSKTTIPESLQKSVQKTRSRLNSKAAVTESVQKPVQKASKSNTRGKKVNKITNYLKSEQESTKTDTEKQTVKPKSSTSHTSKRNLTPEELTPSKKKPVIPNQPSSSQKDSPSKVTSSELLTPKKREARKKLLLSSPNRYVSPKKLGSPRKIQLTPQKTAAYENLSTKDLATLVNDSRSKILFSGRLDELKKSLETFSNVAAKTKEFQANSCKITSVISSKSNDKEPAPVIQGEPAYKKFSYLAAPNSESSLILPYKYKLLGETFCCMDTVVKMLNNRKEKITFEKVKNGVQEMMKKNFLMNHLGQIMTVFPAAFSLQYEKWDTYTISKNNSSPYQLVIAPNLNDAEGHLSETDKEDKKKRQNTCVYMTPQHILQRKYIFEQNLIKLTKVHHKEFLKRKNFPAVPDEKIVRWHPDFPVDSVPNIPVAALPEEPEVKVCTAKDVLNKIKGSFRGKVEKALQSVSDEHKADSKEKHTPKSEAIKNSQNKKQSSALKGICTDLLEKIRARESAKIIETMTRSAQDEKRLAMLERIPKIVHILWHYFIAERKAAVPVDVAVDKIIHSFNSLTTPDSVKEHLELIRETMPGWLSIIKISKGEYMTIDKKKDINVMLSNLK